jgi:gluconolactonase
MKKVLAMTFAVALLGGLVTGWAADHSVIAAGAKLQKLADQFKFTEGPTADASGNVFFTDEPNDRICKWSVDGKLSAFLHPCGQSNGLCFDAQGNLWACSEQQGELWCIDPRGEVTVVVKGYQGRRLDGPNDVWVRPDGGLYFTDPNYVNTFGLGGSVQDSEAVFYLSPDHKKLVRVIADLTHPNGIIGTPEGKILYVGSTGGDGTHAYDIQQDGTLTNKRLFCSSDSDGMTVDNEGNVYLTGMGGVYVFDKTGKMIESIGTPNFQATNVCFGGNDLRTLFITSYSYLFAIRTRVKGVGRQ